MTRSAAELVDEFDVAAPPAEELVPDYNVAPTKPVYAVLERRPRGASGSDAPEAPDSPATRGLHVLRWGLVPSWAKDPAIGSRLINARVETVGEKPSFARAFARRRCVLPAAGYYEWYAPQGDESAPRGRRPAKQPYFIHRPGGGSLAMAGLYEFWRDPTRARADPAAWLWTATILTTTATDALGHIHDRSPLLVPPEHLDEWLDPATQDPTGLADLLVAATPDELDAYPVSTAVNSVANNGPELLDPIPLDDPPPGAPPAAPLDAAPLDAAPLDDGALW